jgi:phage/conjugal plasmid C-4 type zinc finger TraR family protein
MTDFCEVASEREQSMRDEALRQHARRAGFADQTPRGSARRCRACAEPIPDLRRQALPGVQTCLDCQRALENALRFNPHPLPEVNFR